MRLTSAGAAGTVTGSCHLIEADGRRILVDCGLFQGEGNDALNREAFPFDPRELDAVLVTHGHLDHVGRLPLLVRHGYAGPIHATRSTGDIAHIILLDAAELQTEDYERHLRHARKRGAPPGGVAEPLYVPGEVSNTMALFRGLDLDEDLDLGGGVTAVFRPAGHVLGSAFVEIRTAEGRVVASGDLGNRESDIHRQAAPPPACDAVLVETTYGDRSHRSLEATLAEFEGVLASAADECGTILIPAFALERAQSVLYHIKRLMDAGRVPEIPVFLDSPMAARMTRLYEAGSADFAPAVTAALARAEDPFEPKTLAYTTTVEESRRINAIECAIVIAGSGMMTGGRILHHLKQRLTKPSTHLVVVGYQAEGTLGRRLVNGAGTVRIHGEEIEVRARIHTINGFSSHADQDDLLAWLEPTGRARVHLVHGEPSVRHVFARVLAERGRDPVEVERGRAYELT